MSFVSPRYPVRRGAKTFTDRTAIVTPDVSLTYGELGERTGTLAERLQEAGIGAGVQVALMLPNSLAFPVWYYAVLEAGGVVIPLSATTSTEEYRETLGEADVGYLVAPIGASGPDDLDMTALNGFESVEGASLWRAPVDAPNLDTVPGVPEGFYIRKFSSGSTGRPKHIMVTEFAGARNLKQFCETLDLHDGERFIGALPLQYTWGQSNFQTTFHLGGQVAILPRFLPGLLLATARRERPTVFFAAPPMIEALGTCLLEDGDEDAFRDLRYCISTGGPLGRKAHEEFRARFGVSVCNYYGSNEAMGISIDLEDDFEEGRVGLPFNGVTIGIFDEKGNRCPPETPGQIGVRTAAAFNGYVGDPEMTARTIRDGYVFSGDAGFLDSKGRLHLLGRSNVINIGGEKVDRLEVERVIREELPVTDVVVLEGERSGQPVVRAVVEADPAEVTRSMVIEACRARLSRYKIPALVEVRERFERDTAGKVLMTSFDP